MVAVKLRQGPADLLVRGLLSTHPRCNDVEDRNLVDLLVGQEPFLVLLALTRLFHRKHAIRDQSRDCVVQCVHRDADHVPAVLGSCQLAQWFLPPARKLQQVVLTLHRDRGVGAQYGDGEMLI
jgi:hypothetical protein